MNYDVAVIGGGPAGATCAALCAQAGLRTLLLEKAVFPRDKVCGDCVNPACWPIFDELGLADRVRTLPQATPMAVEFVSAEGRSIRYPLPRAARGEMAISRRRLDALLLTRARELGVTVHEDKAATEVSAGADGWKIGTAGEEFHARVMVAADGRNSTVARLLGLMPAAAKDRVGLQTHVPVPADFGEKIVLHFLPHGYGGLATIGEGLLNVCLVSRAEHLGELKAWAMERFEISTGQVWRSITPLARRAVRPAQKDLLLVGDAARVVEPFTGEGIYYALASGALAAQHLVARDLVGYAAAHARLYRGRLWINELAKAAVLQPRLAAGALRMAERFPGVLGWMMGRVVAIG